MLSIIRKNYPVFTLLALVLILAFANYTPNTWLSGWDNLHPEFNFSLNVKRAIFAAWQEYQGLGLLGGMAHASDLIRQLFLWAISFVLPKELIRYTYHFSMVFLGMFGVYVTLKRFFLADYENATKTKAALLGSIFYLCNLGTVQYFFVPFEPYSTFWGFFPWEMYVLLLYLNSPSRRNLFYLFLINLLASAQAYVQTIFIVYILCVSITLGLWLLKAKTKAALSTCGKVLFTIFIINAFWLLPNLYFLSHDLSVTQNAMQNKMATEKFFQMNKNRGTITDFALLREFYYDFFDYDQQTNQFDYLMKVWRNHFSSPFVLALGYGFFLFVLFGLFQKNNYRYVMVGLFFLSGLAFLSATPPFSFVNDLFRTIPILNQIFRNPFTKYIVPTIFVFSICFAITSAFIITYALRWQKRGSFFAFSCLLVILIFEVFPIFSGNFISKNMRVSIPQEYFDTFAYFKTQDPNGRIMNLPQGSFWGWHYYRWGHRGSGFLWYGIEQPIMDRAFDVWSNYNENYYWELSYALRKRDRGLFNSILEKYDISYILFDENIMLVDNLRETKIIDKQQELLLDNPAVKEVKRLGKIGIYKTQATQESANNIRFSPTLPAVSTTEKTTEKFMIKDQAFSKFGPYYSPKDQKQAHIFYPYASLFTNRFQDEQPFTVKESFQNFILAAKTPTGEFSLNVPLFHQKEEIIPAEVFAKRTGSKISFRLFMKPPTITIGKHTSFTETNAKDIELSFDNTTSLSASLILAINSKDYFVIENLSDNFEKIGTTYLLATNLANYFRLYTTTTEERRFLSVNNFLRPEECGASKGSTAFSSRAEKNEIILQVKNSAICVPYQLDLENTGKPLTEVSFTYRSSFDEFPQYCYFSEKAKSCLNRKDFIQYGFSNSPRVFTDYFEYESEETDRVKFNLILEATAEGDFNRNREIRYSNISIASYPLIASGSIELSLRQTTQNQPLSIPKDSTIETTIPKIEGVFTYANLVTNNLYKKSPLNYDFLMPGDFHLEELLKNNEKIIRTRATEASSYLVFRAPAGSTGYGYLVHMETRNLKHFPFIVNIFTDEDFNTYTYTFSSKSKEFKQNYYMLPPMYPFERGVTLLLGTTSYSRQESINDIRNVSLYPLPYEYLTNIFLQKRGSIIEKADLKPVKIAKKHSLFLYEVKIGKNGFAVLSQAYHSGWKAYKVSKINFFTHAFPFLFGEELKEHVLVNNWANGWRIEEDNKSIIIIFLPQYLEFIGFVLFLITCIWILLRNSKLSA